MRAKRRREPRLGNLFYGALVAALLVGGVVDVRGEDEKEGHESSETKQDPKAEFRQQILVTSTHPEFPTAIELSGNEIQKVPEQDLAEALRNQPGLDAVRRGSLNLDPSVRGLVETSVAVLVDGTRTFAAGPGRMDSDLSHVSPHMVERIEVVKGPYALAWGAGALGAIRVETHRPAFGTGGMDGAGAIRYGENGSQSDAFGDVWGAGDSWRFDLMLESRQGADYEDGNGERVPGDYESAGSRFDLAFRPDDSLLIDLSLGYQKQSDIEYPGRQLDATYFYTRSYAVDLAWNPAGSGISEVFAKLYNNRKDHLMNNDGKPTALPNPNRLPPFAIDVDLPTESNTAGVKGHVAWGEGDRSWKAGVDLFKVDQTASRTISRRDNGFVVFRDIVWPAAELEDLGGYLQTVYRRDDFELGATLRVDLADATAGEVSEFFAANTSAALDQSETNLSAAVSGRWRLAESWALTAGVGQAVRSPNTLERYSDRIPSTKFQVTAEFMGDPGLEPETGRQLDLGVQYASSGFSLAVNGFLRVVDDYITVAPDPDLPKRLPSGYPVVFRFINGDKAEVVGGELQLDHQIGEWVGWQAGLSYLDGEDTLFDEPLFGMPPASATVGLRVGPPTGRYWVDLGALMMDAQDKVATSRLEQPSAGYGVVDLMLGYRAGNRLELRAGIENVGDKAYVNHLNSLNPFTRERISESGRNFVVAIDYRP